MVSTLNSFGILDVPYQRVNEGLDSLKDIIPPWQWHIKFNALHFIDIKYDGKGLDIKALCDLNELLRFIKLQPQFKTIFDELPVSWLKTYKLGKLVEIYKESDWYENENVQN